MKKGKIILSAAALLVTAASTVAFKVASKFNGGKQLLVETASGGCKATNFWTAAQGTSVSNVFTSYKDANNHSLGCTNAFVGNATINN